MNRVMIRRFLLILFLGITVFTLASCSPTIETPSLNCGENQTEVDGVCVDDEVDPPQCAPGEVLAGNECVDMPDCAPDEMIVEGACVPKPVECAEGEVEEDGECVSVCNPDEEWKDGGCQLIVPECEYYQELVGNSCDDLTPFEITFTLEEAEADFNQMLNVLNDNNPKLFVDEVELEEVINTQRALLYDGISMYELRNIFTAVVAAYDCGHTYIYYGDYTYNYFIDNHLFFPMTTRFTNKELYVLNDPFYSSIEPGSKILSVNGNTIEDILIELEYEISTEGDNQSSIDYDLNLYFRFIYLYLIDSSTTYTIEYIEYTSGETKEVTVDGKTWAEIKEVEVWDDSVPFSAVYETDYAILKVNTFQHYGDYTKQDFWDFFEEFFTEVDTRGINDVILDVRDNGGGLPTLASDLFSYIALVSEPYKVGLSDLEDSEPHFDGNLYTLIGGGCFSQCGMFTSKIKSQGIGIMIGEETHSTYHTQGSGLKFPLDNSKLVVKVGTQKAEAFVTDIPLGRGVMPDHEVFMTIEDYLAGVDTVLEYTIALIEQQKSTE